MSACIVRWECRSSLARGPPCKFLMIELGLFCRLCMALQLSIDGKFVVYLQHGKGVERAGNLDRRPNSTRLYHGFYCWQHIIWCLRIATNMRSEMVDVDCSLLGFSFWLSGRSLAWNFEITVFRSINKIHSFKNYKLCREQSP